MKENEKEFVTDDPKAFKPIYENPIILDFSGCKYAYDIHEILKEKFGFPNYYGKNWSALRDCLADSMYGCGDYHAKIYGSNAIPDDLKEGFEIMLEIFKDAHKEVPNFTFEIVS